jgi:anthranilate phosphoribosyltransferase
VIDATAALQRILERRDLTRQETEELFGQLMDGALGEAQKAALLVGLAMKGESPGELAGAASAMRRRVVAIPHRCPKAIDTCGTGGDGRGTFNISTAAALVAAAGGAVVAKHGNRAVSSRSGSADVLAALGVEIERSPEETARLLESIGIAFLFAPRLHPAMREVMPVRQALGVRTLFNLLGPLTNPAGARRQLVGVYDRSRVPVLARVLGELGAEHALVVHGADGLDEMSTTGATHIAEVRSATAGDGAELGQGLAGATVTGQEQGPGWALATYLLEPEAVGLARVPVEALQGGTAEENARRMEALLGGEPGPLVEITVLNAGAALYVAGQVASLVDGVFRARELLASGAAARKLDELRSS